MRLLTRFRRKLAKMIFVEDVPQNVAPIRNYRHKMVDEVEREYVERMARQRAEAERVNGTRSLRCLSYNR